jgi:integrase
VWCADFWQDGVHRRVSLRTGNKKVATERATTLAAELAQGVYRSAPPPVTVRQAAADYIEYLMTEDRARKTIVKYRGVFELFAGHLDQHRVTRLSHVTAGHFDKYRAERKATRHAKTVYGEGVIIKQLFKWARSRKLITENPLADIKLHKPPLVPKEGPGLTQVNHLLAAADETLGRWLAVLAFTGMRVGELRRLRPDDVGLAGNWVHVRSRPGAETKTKESRKVPIIPGCGPCCRRCRPVRALGCSRPARAGSTRPGITRSIPSG